MDCKICVLKVFNTISRKKEEFVPLKKGMVRMYVCGPTVYDFAHLGHAKTYVSFDMISRYLEHLGYSVFYVQNITDVGHLTGDSDVGEDKILKRAKREKLEPMELVELYMREYFADMDALGVQRPNISPRATGHILEMIEMCRTLIEKGYAYESNGSVYFDVSKAKHYGELSNRNLDELQSGARVDINPDKRNPLDFALWKKADPSHILQWPSPWGRGFPGWHIECSVMSSKYLGDQIDIHGGAIELSFPHHENEILQSEHATGKRPFVKYWLHTGLLNIDGQKMSKSLDNFVTIKDALRTTEPDVLRFFILSSHYRSPMDYSESSLKEAASAYRRLYDFKQDLDARMLSPGDKNLTEKIDKLELDFFLAMDDDFNTPNALAALFELVRLINSSSPDRRSLEMTRSVFDKAGHIFGLFEKRDSVDSDLVTSLVSELVSIREQARKNKDFKTSDQIRARLAKLGVELQDTPDGVKWTIR